MRQMDVNTPAKLNGWIRLRDKNPASKYAAGNAVRNVYPNWPWPVTQPRTPSHHRRPNWSTSAAVAKTKMRFSNSPRSGASRSCFPSCCCWNALQDFPIRSRSMPTPPRSCSASLRHFGLQVRFIQQCDTRASAQRHSTTRARRRKSAITAFSWNVSHSKSTRKEARKLSRFGKVLGSIEW